jgi:sugar phosphate isomerase/epimerase
VAPLISINSLSLEPGLFEAHVETVAGLGAAAISPVRAEIEAYGPSRAAKLLADAGLSVALLTHMAFGFQTPQEAKAETERLKETIDLAHAIGSPAVCMTTGGRGVLTWKDAAARFAAEIQPGAQYARSAGVSLAIEPVSHLYADASIAHRLSDLVAVAKAAGISVGIDLFACWVDSDLEDALAAAAPLCAFVQVSDYVLGDRGLPCRAVPGDGAVPLDLIVRRLLESGYRGPFDLEVIGPRLAEEGHETGLRRGMARMAQAIAAGMLSR